MTGDRRKEGRKEIPTSGADAPTGLFRSGMCDMRERKIDGRCQDKILYLGTKRNSD